MWDVTVVIPAFNCEYEIARCLASLEGGPDFDRPRIIVVDNGSSDQTAEVARQLGAEVVTVLRPGPAAARNAGFSMCDTEFVAFLDGDCVPCSGWLPALRAAINATSFAAVGGALHWVAASPAVQAFYDQHYPNNARLCASPAPYLLTSNLIFRRSSLEALGGFDSRLQWSEDFELGIRATKLAMRFGHTLDAVVKVRAPDSALDRFAQFFKYGAGLNQVLRLHPGAMDWDGFHEWLRVVQSATAALRCSSDQRSSAWFKAETRAGYYCGWATERTKSALRPLTFGNDKLSIPLLCKCPADDRTSALTIDDGPTTATELILDALDTAGATASFFVIGSQAELSRDMLQKIVIRGHDLYSHSWSHRRFDCLSSEEILNEVERTETLLREIRPTPSPYFFRLPYGAGMRDGFVHKALREWRRDVVIVGWNVSFADWQLGNAETTVDELVIECETRVRQVRAADWPGSVVLLHERPKQKSKESMANLVMLETVLNAMRQARVKARSLSDLLP